MTAEGKRVESSTADRAPAGAVTDRPARAGSVVVAILTYRRPDDLSRVNRAFFTANGVVGLGLLVFAVADLVLAAGLRP